METNETMYKPLVKTPDGKLVSTWAGRSLGVTLEYKEGGITYTPKGGAGIWVCESQEEAQSQGSMNKRAKGVLVVHEVTVLGDKCGNILDRDGGISSFSDSLRYPAIILGKEVWCEKSEEEWVDVTHECTARLEDLGSGMGTCVVVSHDGKWLIELGVGTAKERLSHEGDYRVEDLGSYYEDPHHMFRILKRVTK